MAHGQPLLSTLLPIELFEMSTPYVLIAVGSPGARDEIRETLAEAEFHELDDYRAVA